MLLKNTGEKIVNIGKDILLPGESKSYNKEIMDLPGTKFLIGFGFLRAIEEDADKEDKKEEPEKTVTQKTSGTATADAEEQKKTFRTSRRKAE